MDDSDASFKGNKRNEDQNFQKEIHRNNNALLEPVKHNDHHAIGVIDMFAKNLKRMNFYYLNIFFCARLNILPEIIELYNNNSSPTTNSKNRIECFELSLAHNNINSYVEMGRQTKASNWGVKSVLSRHFADGIRLRRAAKRYRASASQPEPRPQIGVWATAVATA
jgi:hypothetical protein